MKGAQDSACKDNRVNECCGSTKESHLWLLNFWSTAPEILPSTIEEDVAFIIVLYTHIFWPGFVKRIGAPQMY